MCISVLRFVRRSAEEPMSDAFYRNGKCYFFPALEVGTLLTHYILSTQQPATRIGQEVAAYNARIRIARNSTHASSSTQIDCKM